MGVAKMLVTHFFLQLSSLLSFLDATRRAHAAMSRALQLTQAGICG